MKNLSSLIQVEDSFAFVDCYKMVSLPTDAETEAVFQEFLAQGLTEDQAGESTFNWEMEQVNLHLNDTDLQVIKAEDASQFILDLTAVMQRFLFEPDIKSVKLQGFGQALEVLFCRMVRNEIENQIQYQKLRYLEDLIANEQWMLEEGMSCYQMYLSMKGVWEGDNDDLRYLFWKALWFTNVRMTMIVNRFFRLRMNDPSPILVHMGGLRNLADELIMDDQTNEWREIEGESMIFRAVNECAGQFIFNVIPNRNNMTKATIVFHDVDRDDPQDHYTCDLTNPEECMAWIQDVNAKINLDHITIASFVNPDMPVDVRHIVARYIQNETAIDMVVFK